MGKYLLLYLAGALGIVIYFTDWRPPMVDVWPWEDIEPSLSNPDGMRAKNATLLSWDGLVSAAAAGDLKGEHAIQGDFPPDVLADILRAVESYQADYLKPLSHVSWDDEPGRVLVVLTTGWAWSEEAALSCGSGTNLTLEKVAGVWTVVESSFWMS
ncbi:MAG: hypothetical protein ACPG31_01915 [Planctomycetota bacterium]